MKNLITSIDEVINVFEGYIASKYERELNNRLQGRELVDLIGSINAVARTCREYIEENKRKRLSDFSRITRSIFEISSIILHKVYKINSIPIIDRDTSILSLIKKQYNENLHSDFIAALLDPLIMEEFANRLFIRLTGYQHTLINDKINTKWQKSYREVRLDAISP